MFSGWDEAQHKQCLTMQFSTINSKFLYYGFKLNKTIKKKWELKPKSPLSFYLKVLNQSAGITATIFSEHYNHALAF